VRSHILGTGFSVPERIVTNDDLAERMDTSDEWIKTRTGIAERRWITEGQTGMDLAEPAARQALAQAGLEVGDVDAIVYATSTPDHMAPGNGVLLQDRLGADTIPALDIRTQCSGFVYGLSVADAWIRAGEYKHILVVGQEIQSTGLDQTSEGRYTAVIFADGAGAVVVGAHDDPEGSAILAWDLHSDGNFAEHLWVDAPGAVYHPRNQAAHIETKMFAHMDGKEVFRHATTRMPESVEAVLAKTGMTAADLTLLIPHQANLRISELVQRRLSLRDDQVYNNIDRLGNTTAATIPIALDECVRAGKLERGDLVAITAFGSGFLWGSALLRW
jgi:3-oxoacyl-[acyl-carrier-protein] synthase-3